MSSARRSKAKTSWWREAREAWTALRNGLRRARKDSIFDEEDQTFGERRREALRLLPREDGLWRCTACALCLPACPSDCIDLRIDPGSTERGDPQPAQFIVDELACIRCGECVQVCPVDALASDSKLEATVFESRDAARRDLALSAPTSTPNSDSNATAEQDRRSEESS